MKTHHYIFITALLFVIVFYDQDVGLNLGILGVVYSVLTWFKTPGRNKTVTLHILLGTSILSGVAFAWYGDFASFLALVSSLLLLGYRARNRKMKILFLIPVFISNGCTSICRIFSFDQWRPKGMFQGCGKRHSLLS